ncbi:MAG: lipid-A-disaccharide synthase [Alphaproteobacteria bacterium]
MAEMPLFFLIAGEASGDLLGARLMQALKIKTNNQARFVGIGGPRMQAEGIELFFPQAELAHFGLFELLQHIPHLLKRMRQTADEIRRLRPSAVITIDAPDFCFRVAKKLKGEGIPLIHYVAPTVWIWRPKRAQKIAQFLDHLLALLPFEPPYFTREGLDCTFVGHPIVESGAEKGSAERFKAAHPLDQGAKLITVLPGSRMSEVSKLMPIFKETLALLRQQHPKLHAVIPVVDHLKDYVKSSTADWSVPVTLIEGDQAKYDAFAASDAALACSGTVAIELALARLPAVIAYKVSELTYQLYRHIVNFTYASLVNIMHKDMVVPECIQKDCTPEKLSAALHDVLTNEPARQQQIQGLKDIALWLGQGKFVPSERAAETVLDVVHKKPLTTNLTVLQIIPHLGAGGAEQACVDVAAGLKAAGHDAIVVSSGGMRVEEITEAGAIHVQRDVATKNPLKMIANAYWLADFIRDNNVDVIHARSRAPAWSAYWASRMTKRPFVTTNHAAYKFSNPLKKFYNSVMVRGDRIIAISRFIAGHIEKSYGVARDKVRTIPRGIDLAKFDPDTISTERQAALRQEWGLEKEARLLLLPSRLSPIKGQLTVIEAMALLPQNLPLTTVILGDDQGRKAYREELEALVAKHSLGNRIKFIPHCRDMPLAYSIANLVIAPSLVPEGFGRVPVEAMAMGTPVIATELGGFTETIQPGVTGWLVMPNNPRVLANVIEQALNQSPQQRDDMRRAAMNYVRTHFDTDKMVGDTLAVYTELVRR